MLDTILRFLSATVKVLVIAQQLLKHLIDLAVSKGFSFAT